MQCVVQIAKHQPADLLTALFMPKRKTVTDSAEGVIDSADVSFDDSHLQEDAEEAELK